MLCSDCQDIFNQSIFLDHKVYTGREYKHKTYTRDIREAALINGCQICALLCVHFDREDPENRPLFRLDLSYLIRVVGEAPSKDKQEVTEKSRFYVTFMYTNQAKRGRFMSQNIDDEKGVSQSPIVKHSLILSHRCPSVHLQQPRLAAHKHIFGRGHSKLETSFNLDE
jgi:hypothetical protein